MKKALEVIWGLLFDDARLVLITFSGLAAAFIASAAGQKLIAAGLIWLGLIAALWISIDHELKARQR